METLAVTLTLSAMMSLLALMVGGVIGWVARQHSYDTTPQNIYGHLLPPYGLSYIVQVLIT